MTATSFLTLTRRKKLRFLETALSFAVNANLPHLSVFLFGKLWRGPYMRGAFDRCEEDRCTDKLKSVSRQNIEIFLP